MIVLRQKKEPFISYFRNNWQLYLLFMLPAFLLVLIFKYFPIGGLMLAFIDYIPSQGILGSDWVGFKNFQRFLSSTEFWKLFLNTLKLSFYNLIWGFFPPILLALLLNRIKNNKIKSGLQLIYYAPNFISIIVLAGIIIMFLSPTGPINTLFGTNSDLMTEASAFRTIYIASGIWQSAGWASIIYTASLSNVSQDLIDAAKMDGANLFQQIKNIELPTLKPIIVIQLILAVGQVMSLGFEKVLSLQNDLNMETSDVIATYVYRLGLQIGDYSYSTAVGLFNSIINLFLLIITNFIVTKISQDNEGL